MVGFTSGEGCFFIYVRKPSTCIIGKTVSLKFQITQHSKDTQLMKNIVTFLRCGRIELNLARSSPLPLSPRGRGGEGMIRQPKAAARSSPPGGWGVSSRRDDLQCIL